MTVTVNSSVFGEIVKSEKLSPGEFNLISSCVAFLNPVGEEVAWVSREPWNHIVQEDLFVKHQRALTPLQSAKISDTNTP